MWTLEHVKICSTCRREFVPSSKHRQCPACRSRGRLPTKTPCPQCGGPKQRRSQTCLACRLRRDVSGANNPNWKGTAARHKNQRGYVYVRAIGHPRGAGNGGYVLEHIVVMEAILGRYLLPSENVHHKNGRKDDNRAENLELWVRPQPGGQRVQDALAWAREILARYENAHL